MRNAVTRDANEALVPIASLYTVDWLQPRTQLNTVQIDALTIAYEDGEFVPPLVVLRRPHPEHPELELIVEAGHHRFEAAWKAELDSVNVVFGLDTDNATLRERAWLSNTKHGLPYTYVEKRARIVEYLQDGTVRSNRQMAKLVGVDESTVRKAKETLCGNPAHPKFVEPGKILATAFGKFYEAIQGIDRDFDLNPVIQSFIDQHGEPGSYDRLRRGMTAILRAMPR